jgi:hypothetical protein
MRSPDSRGGGLMISEQELREVAEMLGPTSRLVVSRVLDRIAIERHRLSHEPEPTRQEEDQ